MKSGKNIRIISVDSIPDDGYIYTCGFLGAPLILLEKFSKGDEVSNAVQALIQETKKIPHAIMSVEMAGCNALEPMIAAANLDIPVLDGDHMGRAFPELQMVTSFMDFEFNQPLM